MHFSLGGLDISGAVLALGAITGVVYGVLGVGLVLIYRSNRVINFAHGDIGAFGAAFLGSVTASGSFPYWAAFLLALAISGAIGMASEAFVIRRLSNAPLLISVIATLGLGQTLHVAATLINGSVGSGATYPQPPGLPTFGIGALKVTQSYSAMLFITPLIVVALALFLSRSRLGFALRAAAVNPDAARMSGILPGRMSGLAWGAAGALAAYTAILVLPTRGFSGGAFLGAGLLLRALVCGVAGRMSSLSVTFAAGVGLGVVESVVLANYPSGGLVDALMLGAILLGLLSQRAQFGRLVDKASFAVVQAWAPLPASYSRVWSIRNLGRLVFAAGALLALVLPAFITNSNTDVLIVIATFSLVGLSVGVVTGLGGQLSLGQFALAGVGAAAAFHVTDATGNFLVGALAAGVVAAAVSTVIGIPALRIKGLMLAVITLAFALAASSWLLPQSWALGSGVVTRRPAIGSTSLTSSKQYYFVVLAFLAAGLWLARNVWKSGFGRQLRAVRDNEDAARAFTVSATLVKLQSFAVAGFLAGLGGAVYGHYVANLAATAFPYDASINAAAVVVLGGIGVLIGPLLGALYIVGIPSFLPLDNAALAATSAGWLLLVLQYPGGIAQALAGTRDWVVDLLARRAGLDPAVERSVEAAGGRQTGFDGVVAIAPSTAVRDTDRPVLEARLVAKRFGGVNAVDGVDLVVAHGETVGLIGPNGAGKTTLFEILSGFTKPDSGVVRYLGTDVTRHSPEQRGREGLIRSFQDAGLFPTMTVLDTVMLALERVEPTRFGASLLGLQGGERRKLVRAHELVAMMGLYDYRDRAIRELSTGTRRITELACMIALAPTLLLLDEPTSGIAQRETEALGRALQNIKEQLRLSLLIIEHDIPLVMSLADRVVAMETGRVIADGPPAVVASDPLVVEAYLGGETPALRRSHDNGKRTRRPTKAKR